MKHISTIFSSQIDELNDLWLENLKNQAGLRIRDLINEDLLVSETRAVLEAFIRAIGSGEDDIDHSAYTRLKQMLTSLSASRAELGFTPTETAISVMSLKDALLPSIQVEFEGN